MSLHNNHLLTGNELNSQQLMDLLNLGISLKKNKKIGARAMKNRHLALLFEKPSLRTRFSFIVAMHELGGQVVESVSESRKFEEPEDQIRVIQGYCDIVMIRTHDDIIFERIRSFSKIPIINGLSNLYHPCQILADLMTLKERFTTLENLSISYIGDGNNILHSLLLMAPKLGINVNYSCPKEAMPNKNILNIAKVEKLHNLIHFYNTPREAVKGCDAIYTDVWNSMGFDKKNEELFTGYQVNDSLLKIANNKAVVMHCMPMERGKEISEKLIDNHCSVIFQQSENRMHAQKALLMSLIK